MTTPPLPVFLGPDGQPLTDKDEIIKMLAVALVGTTASLMITNDMLKYFAEEHGEEGHEHEDGTACFVSMQVAHNNRLMKMLNGEAGIAPGQLAH